MSICAKTASLEATEEFHVNPCRCNLLFLMRRRQVNPKQFINVRKVFHRKCILAAACFLPKGNMQTIVTFKYAHLLQQFVSNKKIGIKLKGIISGSTTLTTL